MLGIVCILTLSGWSGGPAALAVNYSYRVLLPSTHRAVRLATGYIVKY
jgi:hypothetical protein